MFAARCGLAAARESCGCNGRAVRSESPQLFYTLESRWKYCFSYSTGVRFMCLMFHLLEF